MGEPGTSTRTRDDAVQRRTLLALGRVLGGVGVNLGDYRRAALLRRLSRRMRGLKLGTIEDYVAVLAGDEAEARRLGYELQRALGTLVRDDDAQAALARALAALTKAESAPQLWLPGCGNGEDAFALAMIAAQVLTPPFTVYGSDAELAALALARSGAWPPAALPRLREDLRARYLVGAAEGCRVAPALLRNLVFLAHDFTTPPPLFELDLICCRGLLNVLELSMQRRVLEGLQDALRHGGLLLVGPAETLPSHGDLFIAQGGGLFRRVDGAPKQSAQLRTSPFVGERESGAYRAAFRHAALPALVLDENFDICDANAAATALMPQVSQATLIARNLPELFADDGRERILDALQGLGALGSTSLTATLGGGVAVSLNLARLESATAPRYYAECTAGDADSAGLRSAVALNDSRIAAAWQTLGEGVIVLDADGRVVEFNPSAERLTGWSRAEALGQPHARVFRISRPLADPLSDHPVEQALAGAATLVEHRDLYLQHRDARRFALTLRVRAVTAKGGAVLVFEDVSERNLLTEELAYRATHDALTGLLNREEFESRCRAALAEARRSGRSAVLAFIDVDQFKVINDTLGHVVGDELLHELAGEFRTEVSTGDALARLGGDEFGVLLDGADLQTASVVLEALLDVARRFRFAWNGQSHAVTISIGAALIDGSTENIARAMSMADAACFVAKDAGRDRARYAGDDDELARRYIEMSLVGKIGKSLDEGRFVLHFEDVVPLAQPGHVVYRELLVRMRDDDGRLLTPTGFIQAAERYFLMNSVDRWVLRRALADIAKLPADDVVYALNLSGQSLGDDKFLDYVLAELESSGVDPERICFEITETAAVSRLSEAVRFIERVSACGCRFALDDFGSGMASFSYLKNFRVDYLKIDGSFVRAMLGSRSDRRMVESINRIGHEMGLKTIAEHVENAALLAPLKEIGVDWAQGRAIAWAQPFETLTPLSIN